MKPHGIMFHHFYDDKHCNGQGAISAEQLRDIIDHYGRDNILPAKEWFDRAIGKRLKSNDICLTFDDSLLCQYEVALPVLEKYNLTAFWFVYTSVMDGEIEMFEVHRKFRSVRFTDIDDFYETFFRAVEKSAYGSDVESALKNYSHDNWKTYPFYTKNDTKFRYIRDTVLGITKYNHIMSVIMQDYKINLSEFASDLWMTAEHLKTLNSRGHIIGLHSHTHPMLLSKLPASEQRKEYQRNYKFIFDTLGERPVSMSHPRNSYNEETLSILENDLKIQLGFRDNMKELAAHSKYEFPREDHANILRRMSK